MTEIGAALVKELRDATNVSMMECKKALVEAGGDMAKATKLLRERGMAVAAKKATRVANQGLVASASADNGRIASLVEVNCETDFVARNENFKKFVEQIAQQACTTDASLADTLKDTISAKIAEIGENIVLRSNTRFVLQGTGGVGSYIHLGGKVGVLVEVSCTKNDVAEKPEFKELVKDLTLQVAAASPRYLDPSQVPAEEIAAEREIFAKQVQNKPPQIVDKIVDGKLRKHFEEICLVHQLFVKEQKQTIKDVVAATAKKLGDTIAIRRFIRCQIGK